MRQGRNRTAHDREDGARGDSNRADTIRTATVTAILAEYQALRAEAKQRINNQLLIFAGSVALAAAVVPVAQHSHSSTRWQVLLGASVLFGLVGGLYFDQHHFVNQIGRYIDCWLRPRLLEELGRTTDDRRLFGWEIWLQERDRYRLTFVFRFAATFGVGIACLSAGLALAISYDSPLRWYDYAALCADALVYGGMLVLMVHWFVSNRLRYPIAHPRPADPPPGAAPSPETTTVSRVPSE